MSRNSYYAEYTDNITLSLVNKHVTDTGGNHSNVNLTTLIFNIDSGELISNSVDDLIIDINDLKLIALLQKKLIAHANTMMDGTEAVTGVKGYDAREDYSEFDKVRLNNNFHIDAYGVTFIYNPYDIAPYYFGSVSIIFSYKELKPFIKKSSKLYYLFK